MVAEHPGVAVAGAGLLVVVDMGDRGVKVDHQALRPGARTPAPAKQLAGGRVEPAHLAEADLPEPLAGGRAGPRVKSEHRPRGPGPQPVGVVDRVGGGEHRDNHRERRGPGSGADRRVRGSVHEAVDHLLGARAPAQGRR